MTAVDMVEISRLGTPTLSSDGRWLAYDVSQIDWADNEIDDTIEIRDLTSAALLDLAVLGIAELLEESVHWRPGHQAFLATGEREAADNENGDENGNGDEHDQAYLVTPATGEIVRLTDHHDDVDDVSWLPDGQSFLFTSNRPDDSDADWQIRPYDFTRPDAIYQYRFEDNAVATLVDDGSFIANYTLSRDGNHILYQRRETSDPDRSDLNELWLLALAGGEPVRLTVNSYNESRAKLSPDSQSFAFIATVNAAGEPYYEDNLFLQQVGSLEPELLFADTPIEVLDFAWSADGAALWVLGNIGLRTELFRYDLAHRSLDRATQGDHVIDDWHYDPILDRHVATVATAGNPGEVYEIDPGTGSLRALTSHYADWPERFRLPRQEAVRWRSDDGYEIEGLLVYPIGYEPGQRFPLVTITHGGPRSSSQFGSWNASRYVPVLAGQGYGVLLPNHRGGTGYGDAFMRDMVGNYFRNAHLDVLSGIDALVERGLADPDRLVKMGWSAGGHMTNRLITITDRFAAASSGAGVADWVSLYGESDRRRNRTPWFGGSPWEEGAPLDAYRAQSPLAGAWNVRTPTLFFTGEDDERVPPTQGILMYRAVRAAGTPTELYIADGEPHNFREPRNRLFKINAELQWYARHLGLPEYQPVLPLVPDPEPDEAEADEVKETVGEPTEAQ
ncbi:prolyl oligopeptidase family serine peptidase [Parasphingopyxis sp.]|uniref:S9 family peptidase n=1 Tax=Parasphingopyxis sp. TaxID=1920299 RepID=UPI0026193754|nr:prolyl oligopeptidase family serine peptidase [Parasphingopyxis sp.]